MIHFLQDLLTKKIYFFLVLSIAVSMSILAVSLGALTAASYSTFCKFGAVDFESCHD